MQISDKDNSEILRYLGLGLGYLSILLNKHTVNYKYMGDQYVMDVKYLLAGLNKLDENYDLAANDPGNGLKKADTLEWFGASEGGKFSGLLTRRNELLNRLRVLIDMPKTDDKGFNTPIYRG